MNRIADRIELIQHQYITMLNLERSWSVQGEASKAQMIHDQITGFESALDLVGLDTDRDKGTVTLGEKGLTVSKLWISGVLGHFCESEIVVRNVFGEWAEADPLKLSWDEKRRLIFIESGAKTVKGPEGGRI